MDPAHRDAHRRLWTDLVRRAQPGYVAAPASLLAFTAWQSGDGALANIALDRALADTPGYSMALLLQEALDAGMPPSAATLPMTPEQVAASYAARDTTRPSRRDRTGPGSPAARQRHLTTSPCAGPGRSAPGPGPRTGMPALVIPQGGPGSMTSHTALLDRVRKLLAKAEAEGVTPAEAEVISWWSLSGQVKWHGEA